MAPRKRGMKNASKKKAEASSAPEVDTEDVAINENEEENKDDQTSKNGEATIDDGEEVESSSSPREKKTRAGKRTAASIKNVQKVGGKKSKKNKSNEENAEKSEENETEVDQPEDEDDDDVEAETTSKKSLKSKKKDTKKKPTTTTTEENGSDEVKPKARPKRSATIASPTIRPKRKGAINTTINVKSKAKSPKSKKGNKPKPQYEVESIVDMRVKGGKNEFCVKWKGYAAKHNTWEPQQHLNCPQLLTAFLNKADFAV